MVNFDVDPAGRDDGGERAVEHGQWRTPVGQQDQRSDCRGRMSTRKGRRSGLAQSVRATLGPDRPFPSEERFQSDVDDERLRAEGSRETQQRDGLSMRTDGGLSRTDGNPNQPEVARLAGPIEHPVDKFVASPLLPPIVDSPIKFLEAGWETRQRARARHSDTVALSHAGIMTGAAKLEERQPAWAFKRRGPLKSIVAPSRSVGLVTAARWVA